MSTQPSGSARAGATRPVPARQPELQVVPRRAVVRRGSGFVVLLATILVSGLVGLLLLNLTMQKDAFELTGLQAQTSGLLVQQQALDQQLERIQSTQHLARRASRQGMVPSTNPMFLDLSDGSIIGKPVPAVPGQTLPGLGRPEANGPNDRSSRPDTTPGMTSQQVSGGQNESPARRRGD